MSQALVLLLFRLLIVTGDFVIRRAVVQGCLRCEFGGRQSALSKETGGTTQHHENLSSL
jgi:hypothetical protein